MYVNYRTKNGTEYVMAVTSVRKGSSVVKEKSVYLGRVTDKEAGIFRSRDRGLLCMSLKQTHSILYPMIMRSRKRRGEYSERPVSSVTFGDVFLLDQYIRKTGLSKVIDAINYRNSDALYALAAYYVLCYRANSQAAAWWELSYAKYLYPKAQLTSQRISEALEDIGSEDARRSFFREYYNFLKNTDNKISADDCANIDDGILIGSSGIPYAVHCPLTAASNHNGVVSNEIRLIYVLHQKTGLPLCF